LLCTVAPSIAARLPFSSILSVPSAGVMTNQPLERLRGFRARLRVLQRLSERRHLLALQLSHLGMEERRWLVGVLKLCVELFPAGVKRLDFGFHVCLIRAASFEEPSIDGWEDDA